MHPSIVDHAAEIEALCRRYGVARLDLFGSAARGDFEAGTSDFDFLVAFRAETKPSAFDNYFGLKEGLVTVLGRSVDLLTVDQVRNRFLAKEIESSRQVVYGA